MSKHENLSKIALTYKYGRVYEEKIIDCASGTALITFNYEYDDKHRPIDVVVIQSGWSVKEKALPDIKKYFSDAWEVKQDKIVGLYKAENKETDRVCYIIGSYHPSYHCWHKEEYSGALKQRIIETRKLLCKEE